MAKVIDITEKLSFNENPVLKVGNVELEVKADAENMLKIMGLFSGEKNEIQAAVEAAALLFSKEDQKKINSKKLSMKDYMILIKEAMDAAMGEEESGE